MLSNMILASSNREGSTLPARVRASTNQNVHALNVPSWPGSPSGLETRLYRYTRLFTSRPPSSGDRMMASMVSSILGSLGATKKTRGIMRLLASRVSLS